VHARSFAVHFLSQDDEPLARLFGTTSGDDADKFGQCAWEEGAGGVPLLTHCPNRFVAERVALLDEGSDHVCLVLQPTSAWSQAPFRPLHLSQVEHLQPGHESEERPKPAEERSA
jgi:flavin reductase (DIM6/NTAB) family NADH-FMN oxidoreductase RutF